MHNPAILTALGRSGFRDDPFPPLHAVFPLSEARLSALLSQPDTQHSHARPAPDSIATDMLINTPPANEAQLFCEGCQDCQSG